MAQKKGGREERCDIKKKGNKQAQPHRSTIPRQGGHPECGKKKKKKGDGFLEGKW